MDSINAEKGYLSHCSCSQGLYTMHTLRGGIIHTVIPGYNNFDTNYKFNNFTSARYTSMKAFPSSRPADFIIKHRRIARDGPDIRHSSGTKFDILSDTGYQKKIPGRVLDINI